jgi:hypothetical protein
MSEVDDEPAKLLSIGTVIGGATAANRGWREPIRDLSSRVSRARDGLCAPLNLNVVFHIPGHILQPEFKGVRTGSYSRARSLLMVQVTLPEQPPDEPLDHLTHAVLLAIDEAGHWAERRRVAIDLSTLRLAIERAAAATAHEY